MSKSKQISVIAPVYVLFTLLVAYFPLTYIANNWPFVADSFTGFGNLAHLLVLVTGILGLVGLSHVTKKKSIRVFYGGFAVFLFMISGLFVASATAADILSPGGLVAFLTSMLTSFCCLGLLVISAYSWGKILIRNKTIKPASFKPYINIALGLAVTTLLLFVTGAVNQLSLWTGGLILILPLLIRPGSTLETLKKIHRLEIKPSQYGLKGVVGIGLLFFFISSNFLTTLLPFPMGWDALGLYVNTASLISDYSGLVAGHQAYNWSLLMSLGFLVQDSAEIALGISMLGGMLSVFAVIAIAREWLGRDWAIWSALIFYALPTIGFQSTKDFKIDLGLLFISLAIFMLLFATLKNSAFWKAGFESIGQWTKNIWQEGRTVILAGILCGFAFGIKYTAIFIIFSFLSVLWYRIGKRQGLIAFLAMAFYLVLFFKLDELSGLRIYHLGIGILKWTVFGVSVFMLGWMFLKQRSEALKLIAISAIFGLCVGVAFSPWIIKNAAETGSLNSRVLLFGQKMAPEKVVTNLVRPASTDASKPFVNQFTRKTPSVIGGSAKIEEIQRFIGYEPGIIKYLSVPVDISVGNNVSERITHIGFLFAVFLPLFFMMNFRGRKAWIYVAGVLVFIGLCAWGVMHEREDSWEYLSNSVATDTFQGIVNALHYPYLAFSWPFKMLMIADHDLHYYLAYPTLFLLTYFLAMAGVQKSGSHSEVDNGLWIYVSVFFFLWLILGGGIAWYGYFLIALAPIGVFRFMREGSDLGYGKILRIAALALIFGWTALVSGDRLFTLDQNTDPNKQILIKPFVAYISGEMDSNAALDGIHAEYAQVRDVLNRDTDGMIYRVGTFIKYFVEKNDQRVFSDNQLDFFKKLSGKYPGQAELANALKESGFRYIVVDLNTHTIDRTADKSLTNKFIDFMRWINNNPGLELVVTDRVVQNPYDKSPNPQQYNQVFGKIIKAGTIAVYKIKDD